MLFEIVSKRILFLSILEKDYDIRETTVHYFLEYPLCVTYINRVTHGALYLIDHTFRPTFTFVDAFSVDFGWKRTITFTMKKKDGYLNFVA